MSGECMRKIARVVTNILIVILVALFLLSLLYFIHGSLEMCPTEEQQDKAKGAATILMFFFGSLSAACIGIRVKLRRKGR